MSFSTRQRRSMPSNSSQPSKPESYTKADKPGRSSSNGREESGNDRGLAWFTALFALGMVRYMSATTNIIHDCDEVFNYWEPLHYLLYKSGFQTWEYSSRFALRSYLYIIFHEVVGQPASWLFAYEKVRVFYAVRIFLGLLSVISDATLVIAVSRKYGKYLAFYTLAMLCLASGCFFASTIYFVTAVAVAAVGVILGWPFSILAFLPVTLFSLSKQFKPAFLSGAVTSIALLALFILVDYYYYQRWTSSVFNLLVHYVLGGGESHFYGTEGPLFYLRNGFNNFNFCFIFALLFLSILPIVWRKYAPDLLIVVSPLYIWLAFMSLQSHKEERFLYPVYPLVCLAASAVIESFPDLVRDKYSPYDKSTIVVIAKVLRPGALCLILCASHARTFSLINGYAAPFEVYKILDHYDDAGTGSVLCVGSEWHRFPSSFFVPDFVGEVRWINDGFQGLLPFPFNATLGGTSAAPPYLNNKNKASHEQYLEDLQACSFLVELQLDRPYHYRGNDLSTWEAVAALPYLDRELSPAKYRSFFIPYLWEQKNVFGTYKLLKRIVKTEMIEITS
ncbi:hypothetical protein V6N13_142495 [Hibiscus sabdariffa]|uniref:Mannosyltransferase n=1 Tax=Hibiscus sabdariffa TaxID=183260 RepID=A0ABR2FEC2_9ROSI